MTCSDRLSISLSDMTLNLAYSGVGSRGKGGMIAPIPELELALFGKLLFHYEHLLPS